MGKGRWRSSSSSSNSCLHVRLCSRIKVTELLDLTLIVT